MRFGMCIHVWLRQNQPLAGRVGKRGALFPAIRDEGSHGRKDAKN